MEWLNFKRLIISSFDKDMEQLELSYTAVENAKWFDHFGKLLVSYKLNIH